MLIHAAWPTSVKLNSWWHFLGEKKSPNLGVLSTVELLQEAFWWVIIQLSETFGSKDIKNILRLHSFHSRPLLQMIFLPPCTAIYILCRIFIHALLTAIITEYLFTENSAYTSTLNSCWVALDGAVWNSGCKSIISSVYICISQIFLLVSFYRCPEEEFHSRQWPTLGQACCCSLREHLSVLFCLPTAELQIVFLAMSPAQLQSSSK